MNLDDSLGLLALNPSAPLDVAEVALLIARDEYTSLDVEAYLNEFTAMAHEAKRYLCGDLSTRVTGLCRYLFHEMGFRGNMRAYYDPRNSYLNQVLDRRTGIPITLSLIAIAVAHRAGFPVGGVALPGHFIAKAVNKGEEVLFDPFHGGRILTPEQCEALVYKVTGQAYSSTDEGLQAQPPALIIARMLTNLKVCYLRARDFDRAIRVIERLRQLIPHDPDQQRDLGLSLVQAGQPGRALDHLDAYLKSSPNAQDGSSVKQMLDRARTEIARWN